MIDMWADNWAEVINLSTAWVHIELSPECRGAVMSNAGRTRCGRCEWRSSARLADVGTEHGARFALFVLAVIGSAFDAALVERITADANAADV